MILVILINIIIIRYIFEKYSLYPVISNIKIRNHLFKHYLPPTNTTLQWFVDRESPNLDISLLKKWDSICKSKDYKDYFECYDTLYLEYHNISNPLYNEKLLFSDMIKHQNKPVSDYCQSRKNYFHK